jgi:hypothetical protein
MTKNSGPIELARNQGTHRTGVKSTGGVECAKADRKPQRGDCESGEVHAGLEPRPQAAQPVRIGIAAEQKRLVDQHGAVPDRRRPAETRKRHPADHRLGEEEEERAGDDRRHEERLCEPLPAGFDRRGLSRH